MDLFKEGDFFLKRKRPRSLALDLGRAEQAFLLSLKLLSALPAIDTMIFPRLYFKLSNVRADMSYNRRLSLNEMEVHVEAAGKWATAAKLASVHSGDPGVISQIELEQAILAARESELRIKRGIQVEEIQQLKDDSIMRISQSLQQLQNSNSKRYAASSPRAAFCIDRIQRQ